MNSPLWDEPEQHVPVELLVLHADGELGAEQERRTAEHIKVCWLCRTRSEEIARGIRAFVEYRRDVLLAALPAQKATREEFERLLREWLASKSAGTGAGGAAGWFEKLPARFPPPVWMASAGSVLFAVVLLLFPFAHVSPLTAGEFLSRVRHSETPGAGGSRQYFYQKVRIRRGHQVVIRECYKGLRKMAAQNAQQPEWAAAASGPMSWQDPLNVEQFVAWRQAAGARNDSISEERDRITLTTIPVRPTAIQSASLTVRRSDWHTVSKRIEIEGQPAIEADELAFETRAIPEDPDAAAAGGVRERGRGSPADGAEAAAPLTASKQEDLEVEARLALFDLGAGLTGDEAGITFLHDRDGLVVDTVTSSEERRDLLVEKLTAIAGVKTKIVPASGMAAGYLVPSSAAGASPSEPMATGVRLEPALKKELDEYSGDEMRSAERARQILQEAGKLRSLGAVLRDLAERYPAPRVMSLSATSREKLEELASRVMDQMSEALASEDSLAAPILESRLGKYSAPSSARSGSEQRGFEWQRDAEALFRLASMNDQLAGRMFAATTVLAPETAPAEEQIRNFIDVDRQLNLLLQRRE